MPSVDVIIPCYNYAHYLPQCVDSVLSQDVSEVRIVIIDNASTDNSVEVARHLAESDPRIELVCHPENLGPHASFNEGIDLARADYFLILCADDLMQAGSLKRGIETLEQNPGAIFVVGASAPWAGQMPPEPTEQPEGWDVQSGLDYIERCCQAIGKNPGVHAILVRTSAQKAAGHYRASLKHMDDLEMALRLGCMGSVVCLHAALAIQRTHAANLSNVLWEDRLKDLREQQAAFDSFFRREGRNIPRSFELHRIATRRTAETAFWSAASHIYRGKTAVGLGLFKYSLNLRPSLALIPPVSHLFRTNGALKRVAELLSAGIR